MRLLCTTLATLLLTAGAAAEDHKPWPAPAEAKQRKNPVDATEASVREGARMYRQLCLICHGEKGDGHGPWRDRMATDPSDFTDARRMGAMTDGELFWRMSKGRGLMPGFEKQMNERQRWNLVNYLRTLVPPAAKSSR